MFCDVFAFVLFVPIILRMIAILASQVLIPLRGMHPRFARTVDCFAIDRLYDWIIHQPKNTYTKSVVNGK
jgi:hypothetical protein